MNVDIIIDFFIFCAIIFFFTEFIKRRFYAASDEARYSLFLRHVQGHLRNLQQHATILNTLPRCVLYWSDAKVKSVYEYFEEKLSKKNAGSSLPKYIYIPSSALAAFALNTFPSAESGWATQDIAAIVVAVLQLFLVSIGRLFAILDDIMTRNVLSLLSVTENEEGRIIPKASKLHLRQHQPLLNGDLLFLKFEKSAGSVK